MNRHPLDILSLLLGLVFLIVAVAYFAGDLSGLMPSLQVAMPLMLAGLGIAGVVGAVAAQQRSDETTAYAPEDASTGFEPAGYEPAVFEPAAADTTRTSEGLATAQTHPSSPQHPTDVAATETVVLPSTSAESAGNAEKSSD